jgi:CheY-like chemotaxis protein
VAGQTTGPIIIDAQAEGRLHTGEPSEPIERVSRMAAPPADTAAGPAADTGVVRVVSAEAADDATDLQDANMSPAETVASTREDRLACVLIIEDTRDLAELMAVTLRRAHINAEYEMRGEHAFTRYVALRPAVVLLDLNLPDMTGWKVLESIKEHAKNTNGPMPRIIVTTAMGDPANRLVGKLQGVYGYLVKPFSPAEVQRVVQDALNHQT